MPILQMCQKYTYPCNVWICKPTCNSIFTFPIVFVYPTFISYIRRLQKQQYIHQYLFYKNASGRGRTTYYLPYSVGRCWRHAEIGNWERCKLEVYLLTNWMIHWHQLFRKIPWQELDTTYCFFETSLGVADSYFGLCFFLFCLIPHHFRPTKP